MALLAETSHCLVNLGLNSMGTTMELDPEVFASWNTKTLFSLQSVFNTCDTCIGHLLCASNNTDLFHRAIRFQHA